MLRALVFAAVLAAVAFAVGACGNDPVKPKVTGPPPGPAYPVPRSPAIVLQNLVSAYDGRDSIEIGALYDVNYQGSSTDPSRVPPTINFTRTDEIHHVHRLKTDPNVLNVSLDLGPTGSWVRYPGNVTDPPGAAVIPIPQFNLTLYDTGSGAFYSTKPCSVEFAFRPTVSAQNDTTWTVIRWTEVAN